MGVNAVVCAPVTTFILHWNLADVCMQSLVFIIVHRVPFLFQCLPCLRVGFFNVCFLLEHLNRGIPAFTDTLFSHLFQHYVILRWNKTVKFPSFTVLREIFFGINCTLIHMWRKTHKVEFHLYP